MARANLPEPYYGQDGWPNAGQIVDALSHSPYWNSTAVFLTEDDPQSGLDHVDQHRTIGLVVSPWVAAQAVTAHYDQASMLRTMEEILHLPPMTEMDRTAPTMDALFSTEKQPPAPQPYTAVQPQTVTLSPSLRARLRSAFRRQLGTHPDQSTIPSHVQFQLQWLATHGHPYPGDNPSPVDM